MPNDPFYRSPFWLRLRRQALIRDGWICTAPGCCATARIVDHIVSPRNGGRHVLENLRSLCPQHDNQVKERPGGRARGQDGKFTPRCRPDGMPNDPAHPWFRRH